MLICFAGFVLDFLLCPQLLLSCRTGSWVAVYDVDYMGFQKSFIFVRNILLLSQKLFD